MKSLDLVVSWLVLGPIVPVGLALAAWWTTFAIGCTEAQIAATTLGAGAIGLVAVVSVLRRWAASLFQSSSAALGAVALFYSVMVYGAFMGLPGPNLAVGIVGGAILGRRAALHGETIQQLQSIARRWAQFATGVLFVLCVCSAALALREAAIGREIQHMLHLPFVVTRRMILALIFGGGAALLAFQYFAARAAVRLGARLA